jgi:BirA family biotin operon repressor/biotin-[acetyl-CoA-carboxylase] ligase
MANCKLALLRALADGRSHSSQELCNRLMLDAVMLEQSVQELRELDLVVQGSADGDLTLLEPLELLDDDEIISGLDHSARTWLSRLEIHPLIDSTNSYLLTQAGMDWSSGTVCLAEMQQIGRGRQGRSWLSPFGANLALSLLWRFKAPSAAVGLSLATGIAVARVLRQVGVAGVGLKWPNDVLCQGCKLGGILLESGNSPGGFYVVAGIGLNVALPRTVATAIDQPWIDLREILGEGCVSRNRLAALLISELLTSFALFQENGFSEELAVAWQHFDVVAGRRVTLKLPNNVIHGVARGVDSSGALLLETVAGQWVPYLGGEISLRVDQT